MFTLQEKEQLLRDIKLPNITQPVKRISSTPEPMVSITEL